MVIGVEVFYINKYNGIFIYFYFVFMYLLGEAGSPPAIPWFYNQ